MVDLENCEIRGAGAKTKVRKKTAIVFPDFIKPVVETLLAIQVENSNTKNDKLLTMNKDNFYEKFYDAVQLAGIDNPKNEKGETNTDFVGCKLLVPWREEPKGDTITLKYLPFKQGNLDATSFDLTYMR